MRLSRFLCLVGVLCLYASMGFAQQRPEDLAVTQAKANLEKLQELEQAGAVSKAQVSDAEQQVTDAEDAAVLRASISSTDLNDAQAGEMVSAAERRFERRHTALEKANQLVALGAEPKGALDAVCQEEELARKERDLAEKRAAAVYELTAMAQAEQSLQRKLETAPATANAIAERYDGDGIFTPREFAEIEKAFEAHFGKPLPISAMGETAVHRALGFNHAGRVDVALNPDQPEGVWLRAYLTENHIPYFAFRQAVPGKATGAHIHLGPQSTRLAFGG